MPEGGLPEMVPFYLNLEAESLSWDYFHSIFTLLDTFQLTIQTLDYVLVENSNLAITEQAHLEAVSNDVKDKIRRTWARIHNLVSALLYKLRMPGTAAKMVENTIDRDESLIGCDLKALIGMPGLEEIAANICSSWIEGLEGIMRTKPAK